MDSDKDIFEMVDGALKAGAIGLASYHRSTTPDFCADGSATKGRKPTIGLIRATDLL